MDKRRLLIVDDDDLSREILAVLATQHGLEVTTAVSGEEALALLSTTQPHAVLTDMHMPGLEGAALGRALRERATPGVILLAMSGSNYHMEAQSPFDGFLLKPFTMDAVEAHLSPFAQAPAVPSRDVLNLEVYGSLSQSMPAGLLRGLYELFLNDLAQRVARMQQALEAQDSETFTRAAHALNGAAGMVGASELAGLAAVLETGTLPPVGNTAPLAEILEAADRLRRMLDAHTT